MSRVSRVNRLLSARRRGDHFGEPPEGEERGVYRSRSPGSTTFVQIVEAFSAPLIRPTKTRNARPGILRSTASQIRWRNPKRHARNRRNRAESSSPGAALAPNWKSSPEPERLSSMERFASARKQKPSSGPSLER